MITKNWIKVLFAGLLGLALTACGKEPGTKASGLTLLEQTVDVPAGGGTFEVGYTVENSAGGVQVKPESDAAWINNFDLSKEGKITFSVDRNQLTTGREATVAVTYAKEKQEFTVTQLAGGNFTIDRTTVDAVAGGGNYYVTYSSADGSAPAAGALVIDAGESWVKDFETSTTGKIGFTVEANTSDAERRCAVSVTFVAGIDPQRFTVVQQGGDSDVPFVIEIDEVTYKGVSYTVSPADKGMTYITMAIEAETIDKYSSDEEYFLAELSYFRFMADMYGISLEEYLRKYQLVSGDQTMQTTYVLEPETLHYVYAYGLSTDGNRLTSIVKVEATTTEVKMIDMKITFDHEENVQNQRAAVYAYPNYGQHPYYFSIIRTEGLRPDETLGEVMQGYFNYVIDYYLTNEGGTIREAMDLIAYVGIGVNAFDVIGGKEYVIFGAAMDVDAGLVLSDTSEKRFTATKVGPSDNEIALSVVQEGFTTDKIAISTTNNDTYVFLGGVASDYEGKTDEEILEFLLTLDLSVFQLNGNNTVEITGRVPGTEYIGFAFGYVGGMATTDVHRIKFKAHKYDESSLQMKILHDKYFDAKLLKAAYPEEFAKMPNSYTAVMPVRTAVIPETDGAKFWYMVYEGDWTTQTDERNIYAMGEQLLYEGNSNPATNLYFPYEENLDTVFTLIGTVADKDGNFGGLFREAFTMTRAGMSPVSEYVSPSVVVASSVPVRSSSAAKPVGTKFDLKSAKPLRTAPDPGVMSPSEFIRMRSESGVTHCPVRTRAI